MNKPLVIVKWDHPETSKDMRSVGWLIHDGKRVKRLAANIGGGKNEVTAEIPTKCIDVIREI